MKKCNKCLQIKQNKDFNKRKASKDGLNTWCKTCHVSSNMSWVSANKSKVLADKKKFYYADARRVRNKELKHKFDITVDQYDKMFVDQSGLCKICNKPETSNGRGGKLKYLAVDHDHVTGKVRGLLCAKCNKGLGHFEDSIELLEQSIKYLEEHSPGKGTTGLCQPAILGGTDTD